MIYLIDDKKKRQETDFKWGEQRFSKFSNVFPIYDLETLEQESQKVFSQDNIVIYHESFLDDSLLKSKASEKRSLLENFAKENPNFKLVIFSGSKDSRKLNGNLLHLPVGTLYANLEAFIKSDLNLSRLAFGENIKEEPFVYNKLQESINNFSSSANVSGKVLFVNSPKYSLYKPIHNAIEVNCFDWQTNPQLDQLVRDWLSETVYNHIYIPMCFGNTLSDYNGLRLATHIRCTNTLNRFTPIHIYSPVDISMLLDHEYFNILKTKSVQMIACSKEALEDAANEHFTALKQDELPKEINKLKLDPPLNYADSHSIVNEWAIHQWATTIGCDETEEIEKVFQNVESNLYFKYLRTINPISEVDKISPKKLKINFEGNPKVLLIDDEAEKGWKEIFAYIFNDVYQNDKENAIYQDTIEIDFKTISKEDLVQKSINKIKEDDIDVVILDFRLNPDDFIDSNPKNVTSIQLLKKIKEHNPGIQVIIFSATNKVWNLQALQNAGADGFILKDGSENIHYSINSFKDLISDAFSSIYLKDFHKSLYQVRNNITTCEYEDDSDYEAFLMDLQSQITIIEQAGKQVKSELRLTLDVVFLSCYNFLDLLKSQYIRENDFRFYIGIEEIPIYRYEHNNNSFSDAGEFIKESYYDKPSWFQSIAGLLIDYFQVVGLNDDSIKTLWQIKEWRNKYIHEDKLHFSQSEVLKIVDLMVKITSSMKE